MSQANNILNLSLTYSVLTVSQSSMRSLTLLYNINKQTTMRANVIIAMYRTLKNNNIKAVLTFKDFGNYACLKLSWGKKGEYPHLWSKIYKSQRLLKKLDGIPFIYSYFKHE